MAQAAERLKEKGNASFREGDYESAARLYTQAIQYHDTNAVLFSNRSHCRLKLQQWDGAVNDALRSIEIAGDESSFKAYFYLAEAQFALNHPNEALNSALRSYEHVSTLGPSSTASIARIAALVVKCKKSKFEARQRERARRQGDLLAELEMALDRQRQQDLDSIAAQVQARTIGVVEGDERRVEIKQGVQHKVDELKSVFAVADPSNHAPKEIPDWAIDSITFELIHDPVVTKNGHSYERATIMEYLKGNQTDPLTREKLSISDLRPNIALKKALDEFWENASGWAMEW